MGAASRQSRHDDRDEAERVLVALSAVIRQLTRITGGPDDEPPMTATQRLALFELSVDGPYRLNDLAARLGTSASTASRAVDVLVELGLVERVPDQHDRRAVSLDVTRQGRRRAEERQARAAAGFAPALAALSPRERASLVDSLDRLTAALQP